MNNNNNLGEHLKINIKPESDVNIITKKFSLRTFEYLLQNISLSNCFKVIIADNSPFINFNLENQKRSYQINYSQTNMLSSQFELKMKNDLLEPVIAKKFNELINKKIFFKTIKNDTKNINFYFTTISSGNWSISNTDKFTYDGLGLCESNDFQYIEDTQDIESYESKIKRFQSLWNNELLYDTSNIYIEQLKSIYRDHTPKDIYYFSLYHIFNKNLIEYEKNNANNSTDWKQTKVYRSLYDFQKNAVHGIIEKIEKYNGCILADSVGLGKTFEALAVIKYYELKGMRVLVLVPKKLRENWTIYTSNTSFNNLIDDRFAYNVMNHTDVNRQRGKSGDVDIANFNWDNYDLLVIDESHNFRNRTWNQEENKSKSRYQNMMEKIIKSGRKTKVLLLTATPVNNCMRDIANQIRFITSDNDNAFAQYGIKSIDRVCSEAEKRSNQWSQLPENQRTTQNFEQLIGFNFRNLMDLISIARSRKQIKSNYHDNGLVFPERLTPINFHINQCTNTKHNNTINEIYEMISKLIFACYKPISYIKPEKVEEYLEKYASQNGIQFKQTDREKSLVKIMLTNWLKRFESSICSFKLTINKFLQKNLQILDWLKNGKDDYQTEELDEFDELDENEDYNEIFSKKIKIKRNDVDIVKCISDIEHDILIVNQIIDEYAHVNNESDDKLNQLIKAIEEKHNNPINDKNKKVIIFTTFADTANYLYEHISKHFFDKGIYTCVITGTQNNTNNPYLSTHDMNELLTYFSPLSKKLNSCKNKIDTTIDILIATDCISEGQNLQDSDYLINYDIHWNPVRIIQRFGRIDRIGSINNKIQLVNFWPDVSLEKYIYLEEIVKNKMQKVIHASTGDENIFDNTRIDEDNYRVKQLKELQEKVVDMEDLKGDVSFSSLTLSEYTSDLQLYLEDNWNSLNKQPTGIFAIANNKTPYSKPGIIFLFKNVTKCHDDNPIEPYYLTYIDFNGEIICNFHDVTTILNKLKSIAINQSHLNHDLIQEFNINTNYGFDMNKYTSLLNKAIDSISVKKDNDSFKKLFNNESDFTISSNSFELVAFLIIKDYND